MAVEIFGKQDFEAALSSFCNWTALGIVQHNEAYLVDFGNPHAKIMVYSSIAPRGQSRAEGEDSIRAWLVTPDQKPIGGKTQKYVKRTKNWRINLQAMIHNVAALGRWIQPCPKCNKLLALAVRGDKVFLFCPEDANNRDNKQWQRHIALTVLDKTTGETTS